MKYVIVSIYDSGYDFCVFDNGNFIPQYDDKDNPCEDFKMYHDCEVDFNKWLKNKYKDYDLVVVCENGGVVVLIDKTKTV